MWRLLRRLRCELSWRHQWKDAEMQGNQLVQTCKLCGKTIIRQEVKDERSTK